MLYSSQSVNDLQIRSLTIKKAFVTYLLNIQMTVTTIMRMPRHTTATATDNRTRIVLRSVSDSAIKYRESFTRSSSSLLFPFSVGDIDTERVECVRTLWGEGGRCQRDLISYPPPPPLLREHWDKPIPRILFTVVTKRENGEFNLPNNRNATPLKHSKSQSKY